MTEYELALVGCTKRKRNATAQARDLYDESPLFRRRRRLARRDARSWAILSAEHGLVDPTEELAPYDTHISDVDSVEWAGGVLSALLPRLEAGDRVLILAGGKGYIDPLVDALHYHGIGYDTPLRSLPPGKQFKVLDDWLAPGEQQELIPTTDGGKPRPQDTERERDEGVRTDDSLEQRGDTSELVEEAILFHDEGDRCPECGEIVSGIATTGEGEHVFEPCEHPATIDVRRAVLRRALPDGTGSLADRIDEHLDYLLQEARGRLRWPETDIEQLEADREQFRDAFGITEEGSSAGANGGDRC